MQCPQCHHPIEGRALFCPNCGQKLPQPTRSLSQVKKDTAFAVNYDPEPDPPRKGGWGMSLAVVAIAVLVILAIAGIGVLAVYYGLEDRAKIEYQTAEEHYNRGLAQLEQGELELAIAEFERVIKLNPRHEGARTRLAEVRQRLEIQPTPTPMLRQETKAALYERLREAYEQSDWDGVFQTADQLLAMDPTYQRADVDRMLFNAFYQSGLQLVEQNRMGEAVRLFDRALALQPENAQVKYAKHLASLYLSAMGYWGADWDLATENLSTLYNLAPDYLDVSDRIFEAYTKHGDQLAEKEDYCEATEEYTRALAVKDDPAVSTRRQAAALACQEGPAATEGESPIATGTPLARPPTAPKGTYAGWVAEYLDTDGSRIFVRGRVMDKNGKGLAGVRVQIQAWDWTAVAVTDGNGNFSFDGLNNEVVYILTLLDLPHLATEAPGRWGKITWVNFQEAK